MWSFSLAQESSNPLRPQPRLVILPNPSGADSEKYNHYFIFYMDHFLPLKTAFRHTAKVPFPRKQKKIVFLKMFNTSFWDVNLLLSHNDGS